MSDDAAVAPAVSALPAADADPPPTQAKADAVNVDNHPDSVQFTRPTSLPATPEEFNTIRNVITNGLFTTFQRNALIMLMGLVDGKYNHVNRQGKKFGQENITQNDFDKFIHDDNAFKKPMNALNSKHKKIMQILRRMYLDGSTYSVQVQSMDHSPDDTPNEPSLETSFDATHEQQQEEYVSLMTLKQEMMQSSRELKSMNNLNASNISSSQSSGRELMQKLMQKTTEAEAQRTILESKFDKAWNCLCARHAAKTYQSLLPYMKRILANMIESEKRARIILNMLEHLTEESTITSEIVEKPSTSTEDTTTHQAPKADTSTGDTNPEHKQQPILEVDGLTAADFNPPAVSEKYILDTIAFPVVNTQLKKIIDQFYIPHSHWVDQKDTEGYFLTCSAENAKKGFDRRWENWVLRWKTWTLAHEKQSRSNAAVNDLPEVTEITATVPAALTADSPQKIEAMSSSTDDWDLSDFQRPPLDDVQLRVQAYGMQWHRPQPHEHVQTVYIPKPTDFSNRNKRLQKQWAKNTKETFMALSLEEKQKFYEEKWNQWKQEQQPTVSMALPFNPYCVPLIARDSFMITII